MHMMGPTGSCMLIKILPTSCHSFGSSIVAVLNQGHVVDREAPPQHPRPPVVFGDRPLDAFDRKVMGAPLHCFKCSNFPLPFPLNSPLFLPPPRLLLSLHVFCTVVHAFLLAALSYILSYPSWQPCPIYTEWQY